MPVIQTRDLIKKGLRPVVPDAIKRVSTIQTRGINKKGLRPATVETRFIASDSNQRPY